MTTAPPPPTEKKRGIPKVGSLNVMEVCLGAKGSGKSTFQAMRALDLQERTGGYVIGHSIGRRLPTELPDGRKLPISYYRSVAEAEKGLRKHPGRWHIIAPPLVDEDMQPDLPRSTADDVLRFSTRLSYALRSAAWLDEHPLRKLVGAGVPKSGADFVGLVVRPVIVVIDEGVAIGAAAAGARGRREENDWFTDYLISLRHLHVALFYSAQGATLKSWHLLEQATKIYAFQMQHQWAVNALQAAAPDDETVSRVSSLPKYEYIEIQVGAQ